MSSIESLRPYVEHLIFSLELVPERHGSHFCFHLDYEAREYRQHELARLIRDAVEFFALTHDEFEQFRSKGDAVAARRLAWSRISDARKDKKGDYGELLLFLILSFKMPTNVPRFVTKVRLRSSQGEQIKGFDCAHATLENEKLTLWLGEAKFHQNISSALSDAITSVKKHCTTDYLTKELRILGANCEANAGIDEQLLQALDTALNKGQSQDRLQFKIPVLLTYDSDCVAKHSEICSEFTSDLTTELTKHFATIDRRFCSLPKNFAVLFILVPMRTVDQIKTTLESMEAALR